MLLAHHAMVLPSRKKPPCGPSAPKVAAQTMPLAPTSTERLAPAPPISVLTQPGQTELTCTRALCRAKMRVSALSAALDTRYAELGQPCAVWLPAATPLSNSPTNATSPSTSSAGSKKRARSGGEYAD